ncbi:MAG: HepT-like ribonuclease domain-containing protein [Xanthobacteraceae bacterium]
MPPTLTDRVRHILDAIANIERVLAGKTAEDFAADYLLRLLVERLLEIICEASRRVPENVKASEPGIPWQDMIDFGNRLRHAYHSVDPAIVWEVVTNDLPPLKAFVERVIREEQSGRT